MLNNKTSLTILYKKPQKLKNNKISFLVVNPYDKLISAFKFMKTDSNINVFVKKYINLYKNQKEFKDFNIFIPQHNI